MIELLSENSQIFAKDKEETKIQPSIPKQNQVNRHKKQASSNLKDKDSKTIIKRIYELFELKKQKIQEKKFIKSKILIEKQVGEEVIRRHKEDTQVFFEEEADLDQLNEKKNSIITQYDKKFIEVQIYARREFINKTPNPDIYIFNMNKFINKNVALLYDIRKSQDFLDSVIKETISTKETFFKAQGNNLMFASVGFEENINDNDLNASKLNKSIINFDEVFFNKEKKTKFTNKQLNLVNLLLVNNMKIIKKIENLKFTIKYFNDYRFFNSYEYKKPVVIEKNESSHYKNYMSYFMKEGIYNKDLYTKYKRKNNNKDVDDIINNLSNNLNFNKRESCEEKDDKHNISLFTISEFQTVNAKEKGKLSTQDFFSNMNEHGFSPLKQRLSIDKNTIFENLHEDDHTNKENDITLGMDISKIDELNHTNINNETLNI